ncbi:MAG: hypothetical protein QM831_17200, partial [Kofleriaceae bacterium]
AMAGGVAAAAAALTLADPNSANAKAEAAKREEHEQRPVEVKEQVPASALDHLGRTREGRLEHRLGGEADRGGANEHAAEKGRDPESPRRRGPGSRRC